MQTEILLETNVTEHVLCIFICCLGNRSRVDLGEGWTGVCTPVGLGQGVLKIGKIISGGPMT